MEGFFDQNLSSFANDTNTSNLDLENEKKF